MTIEVLKPGLSTTVQDLGRPGYYHLGIPVSGGMDRFALRAANLLVGNEEDDAVLEVVFLGPELRFATDAVVAVTGAELPPKLDGAPCDSWTAIAVKAGQVLSFDFLKAGARAYVAVSGGIDVPLVLGSRSTYALGALGGLDGRALKIGDILPIGGKRKSVTAGSTVPAELRPGRSTPVQLRVLPGLYNDRITEESAAKFYADTWKVAPEADRIGYRFRGGHPIGFRATRPAVRCRLGSLERRRLLLSLRIDTDTRRDRTHRAPSRCGVGGRVLHVGGGDLGGHGFDRSDAAAHAH